MPLTPEQISELRNIRDAVRAGTHHSDIREVGKLLDGKWDQDFPMAIIETALSAQALIETCEAALAGISAMPEGYCACFNGVRDATRDDAQHTGECRDIRQALAAIEAFKNEAAE